MRFGSTAALSALLVAQLLAAPVVAGEFSRGSRGSGEKPRGGVTVAPLGDYKPTETPTFNPDEARRAAPMTEGEVIKSMTARGITADGKEVTIEPSEALRDLIRKELSGGSRGSDDRKPAGSDKAEAQEGERAVVGADDRIEITEAEEYPFSVIGQVLYTRQSGPSYCSAALIGPRTVITAAHCLWMPQEWGWNKDFQFVPGRTSTNDAPFGIYDAEAVYILDGYMDNYDGTYGSVVWWDLAVVILKEPVGDDLGWLPYGDYEDLGDFTANITGYPGDKPMGTMWFASCDVVSQNIAADYFLTDCDTYPGSSGSAVYTADEYVVVGVNVAEYKDSNHALRLSGSFFEWVDNLNQ